VKPRPDNSRARPRKGPSNCSLYDQVIKNAMRFVDVTNGAIAESPNRSNRFFTAAFFVSISTHNSHTKPSPRRVASGSRPSSSWNFMWRDSSVSSGGTSTPRCGRLGIVRLTAGGAAHTFHRPNSLRSPRNRFKIGPDAIYFINVVPESERARAASCRFLCLFNIADVQEVSRSDRIDPVRSLTLRSFQQPRDPN
jgi:hypothetical protein